MSARADIRPAFDRLDNDKPILGVEGLGVRLGIHDDAHASIVVRHLPGEKEHEPQKVQPQSLGLRRLVDSEPRQPEHWQWIVGKCSPHGEWQIIDLDVRRRHPGKPENGPAFDGDVGDANVMAKLVLTCELVKEAVEVGVS